MKRREFLRSSMFVSGLSVTNVAAPLFCNFNSLSEKKSRIAISKSKNLQKTKNSVDSDLLLTLIDDCICGVFDKDNALEAWKEIVSLHEVIGLKVNCLSGKGSTHPELVEGISERLKQVGIKANNIVIWDRFNSDLEDAGFKIRTGGNNERCFGNDAIGFEQDLEVFGLAGSRVCKTVTRICDGIINLPVLKDHGIAGVTISLKNLFGAIHNPHKYHLNIGDPYIADVFMLPSIRKKIRLTICDAINAQYEGGPSYMPQWSWAFNGLIGGTDPVALDVTGWQLIEEKRAEEGLKSLKDAGREPTYIKTAGDNLHNLGTNHPDRIEIIRT
jgi:uncharacterized protein (DUF362 family)